MMRVHLTEGGPTIETTVMNPCLSGAESPCRCLRRGASSFVAALEEAAATNLPTQLLPVVGSGGTSSTTSL
eukprot:3855806-Amphidinium_carterae.3